MRLMNTLALNTHTFIKRLKAANMTEEQAEVIVDGINAARESDLQNLATKSDVAALKADLQEVESSLNAKIDKVESFLNAKIDKVESSLNAKIDKLESSLNAKIDKVEASLNAKGDKIELRLSGDIYLLKWMIGVVVAGILALILKAYFPH